MINISAQCTYHRQFVADFFFVIQMQPEEELYSKGLPIVADEHLKKLNAVTEFK